MKRKELIQIDQSLDASVGRDSILISKRGFYIYYNEPNKDTKQIKIHSHICGQCAWGSGKIPKKEVGKNGVWIGPFKTTKQAEYFAKDHFIGCEIDIDACVNFYHKYIN